MAKQSSYLAGRLRHRITLEAPEMTIGAGGEYSQSWEEVATVWAAILPSASGGEDVFGEQLESSVSHRITLRYREGITASMRVVFGERLFNIRKVICPEERRETLILLAEEHVAI